MESYVVPETPDQRPARRRSSRRSTMISSIASDSFMRKVTGTPMSQDSVTFVSESPAVNLHRSGDSRRRSVSLRAAQIGISESAGKSGKKLANHPVFAVPTTTNEIEGNASDETFEMYVPATQDLPDLAAVGKVQAWLNSEEPSPSLRKKRKSNIQDVSKYLIGERSRDSINQEAKEHVPYRPPSFQNYSSDSAKALLAQFEAQSISKQDEEDKDNFDSTLETLPKVADQDPIDNVNLDKVLEGVIAFVEVRSKNENRSDVVIGQLLSLGASVIPRLNNRCTHVVFKEGSLSTYNKAKKLKLHIVSVNWIEACKKQHSKPEEHLFPPMNQEKYDSPGLFPKLRKTKSLQPKSDEEFSKLMDAKAKRIMKKKLATEMPDKSSSSPIPVTPKCSPKVPKRRRSQILDTLKEYEEMEKNSPAAAAAATTPRLPATPASPCSSEDLDTPLLKKIAKRLFKAQQASPECTTTPNGYSPKKAGAKSPVKMTRASPSKLSQSPERLQKEIKRPKEINSSGGGVKKSAKKSTPKVNPDPPLSRTRRKKLYTQTSILSQTPVDTPQMTMTVPIKEPKTRGKKQKTKLVKKNSFYVAEQQQNIFKPEASAAVSSLPTFKKPPKRIVRSMHNLNHRRSSMDFIKPLPSTAEKKGLKKQRKKQRELVLTSCNSDDHKMVKEVIKRLAAGSQTAAVKVSSQVLPSTTHVICGNNEGRRTLNMLRAILCGCWIVSLDWVYQCLGQGTWVDEESYEMVSFSAAVKQRRLERDLLPQSNLFKDLDLPMYVGRHCRVPKKELVELIQMAGGKCVNQLRTAKIILAHDSSSSSKNEDQFSVTENWLLDSIQQHCVLPLDEYLMIQN